MVVVFQIQHVPRPALQLLLPEAERPLEPPRGERQRQIVHIQTVRAHALELDHHVHLPVLLVDVFERPLRIHQRRLGDGSAVVVVEHVALELLQILVYPRAVVVVPNAAQEGQQMVVGQLLLLGDEGDHVLAEAVHPLVEPEAQDLFDLLAHEGIVHIEIRLLDGEQVQIVFPAHFVPLPGLALKHAVPVVGQLAVRSGGTPDVIVGVGIDAAAGFLKPLVLVAGVVDHQIHDDLHAARVRAVEHLAEGLHAAVLGRDIHIVGNVVPAVHAGGGVERGEPDAVHPEGFEIVQLFVNAQQIAHAIAISVPEAARPDLIEHLIFIPACMRHSCISLPFCCQKAYHDSSFFASIAPILRGNPSTVYKNPKNKKKGLTAL